MKLKTLLVFAASTFVSMASYAQWTEVKPEVAPVNEVKADGVSEYWLYNVEADGYFIQGNNWWTQACVGKTESMLETSPKGFTLRFKDPATHEGFYQMECMSPDGKYIKNQWKYVFDNAGSVYTDYGSQGISKTYWTVTFAEDGTCKIYSFDNPELPLGLYSTDMENADFSEDDGAGSRSGSSSTGAYTVNNQPGAGAILCTTWKLYGVANGDAVLEYQEYLKVKAVIDGYVADGFEGAAAFMDEIPAQTGSVDAEHLQAIADVIGKVQSAHYDWVVNTASPDSPKDMSDVIKQRTFDGQVYSEWKGSSFGAGGNKADCAERYEMVFDTWQKIEGIPNGVYELSVDGFFRNGTTQNAFDTKGQALDTYLYATNGVDTLKSSIMGMFDGITPGNPVADAPNQVSVVDDEGYTWYLPNSMVDAVAYFEAGYYHGNKVVFAVTDGTATIGVMRNKTNTADWTLLDNFGLKYFGDGAAAYQAWMDNIAENAGLKDYNERKVSDEYLDNWVAAVEEAQEAQASSSEDVVAMMNKLDAAEKALLENEAAWVAFIKMAEEGQATEAKGLVGDEADALSDYMFDLEAIYDMTEGVIGEDGALLSTEDVIAETAKLRKLIDEATENGLQPGTDVTDKIVNASFAKGLEGWTSANGVLGGLKSYPCVEVFGAKVDVSQVVTGLPKGVYELTCQAFERPANNGSYDYDTPSVVSLYMNNVKTPVQNILKDAVAEEEAVEYTNCYLGSGLEAGTYYDTGGTTNADYNASGYGYIPNGMSGASYAFQAGRYKQSAKGLVTDGKMTIGLTTNGQNAHWVLWSKFTLTYLGMDEEIIKPMLDEAVAAVDLESAYGSDVKAKAQALVDEAGAVTDGNEMLNMVDKLSVFADSINASKAVFATLSTALADFENNIYDDAEESLKAAALECMEAAKEGVEGSYTDAEAQKAIEDLADYVRQFAAAAAKGEFDPEWAAALAQATAESPVELGNLGILQNPSFETGNLDGWNVASGTGDTGAKANSNATYTVTNADGDYVFNTWSGSAVDGGFFVAQEFAYLPTGTYQLKALLASDANNTISLAANDNAKEYVMQNAKEIAEQGFVTFFMQEGPLTIKAASNTWFKADAFELLYFGEEDVTSQITDIFTAIADVNKAPVAAPAGIFAINGAKIATLKKGINIVRMADGKVRKVLVK